MQSPKERIGEGYDSLPTFIKEVIWFGVILFYERADNFPYYYWLDEICN